jgi:hypothetical protein
VPGIRSDARTTGTCAFCGLFAEVTRDHVPPENLFAPPRTSDLITVPCCDACREGTSKDDEYLRIALSIRTDASSHPSLATLKPKIRRGLGRPEAERFTKRIESRTEREVRSTPSGLLFPVTIHTPEVEPIRRELTRIAKGLYFRHTGRSLPASFAVHIVVEPLFELPDAAAILERFEIEPWLEIGRGEFSYKYWIGGEGAAEASVWLLRFYKVVPFLVLFIQGGGDKGLDPSDVERFSKMEFGWPST